MYLHLIDLEYLLLPLIGPDIFLLAVVTLPVTFHTYPSNDYTLLLYCVMISVCKIIVQLVYAGYDFYLKYLVTALL